MGGRGAGARGGGKTAQRDPHASSSRQVPAATADRERLLRRPGRGSLAAIARVVDQIRSGPASLGPAGVGPLGAVVDCTVAARRLSGWALWVELAGLAQLVAFWEAAPPIADELLAGGDGEFDDPCRPADPDLADRLQHLVLDYQLPRPVDMHALASAFVTSEVSAATGMSRLAVGLRLDAARALFLDDRLPRCRELLRAGYLDWTKLRTMIYGTQDLDDEVCQAVEAHVISDADLVAAEADLLDVRSDPARPGAPLPRVARMTNPALERALRAAVAAVDAEALAARAARARQRRQVRAAALDDTMARLEVEAAQEAVAAVMNDLDALVAAARAVGDPRTPDQIRADGAIHRLTCGAYGHELGDSQAADDTTDDDLHAMNEARETCPQSPGEDAGAHETYPPAAGTSFTPPPASTNRGLAVSLTMTLSTWLGLAEEPAVLDRFGPIPAALARRIAAEAAREHPLTTTWRCVVVDDDDHRSVVAVADPLRTPRHDPPLRLARLVGTVHPRCAFPGCGVPARRCDLDHRVPYNNARPASGGSTCSCNLFALCRTHHRLKTAGLLLPEPIETVGGGLRWTSATGHVYDYEPPPPTPAGADPQAVVMAGSRHRKRQYEARNSTPADPDLDELHDLGMPYDENWATKAWQRSLHEARPPEDTTARETTRAGRKPCSELPVDPPF